MLLQVPSKNLHSMQRNFMESKSFKDGFSMNIKIMLFPKLVTWILNFVFCQPLVCSFIWSLMSSNVKYQLVIAKL